MTTTYRSTMIGVAFAILIAACGGGDDAGSESTTTVPPATTQPAESQITIVPTSIPDIFGLSDECQGLASVMLGVVQAFAGEVEGTDELFAAGLDSLPSELDADIAVLRRAVTEFAAAMEEIGVNPFTDPNAFGSMTPEQIEQFEQVAQIFDNAEIDRAFASIEEYGARECDEFNVGG